MIGPASVGKSTVGVLLAEKLGYEFVDIDKEFCKRVGLIPEVVKSEGYASYCEKNSKLTDLLIAENVQKTVFATPSGYLVHEESPQLVEKHIKVIGSGISVLLLPGPDPDAEVDTIVARQVSRWRDVEPDNERQRFLARFEKYKKHGDIKIFSKELSEVIVEEILNKIGGLSG